MRPAAHTPPSSSLRQASTSVGRRFPGHDTKYWLKSTQRSRFNKINTFYRLSKENLKCTWHASVSPKGMSLKNRGAGSPARHPCLVHATAPAGSEPLPLTFGTKGSPVKKTNPESLGL